MSVGRSQKRSVAGPFGRGYGSASQHGRPTDRVDVGHVRFLTPSCPLLIQLHAIRHDRRVRLVTAALCKQRLAVQIEHGLPAADVLSNLARLGKTGEPGGNPNATKSRSFWLRPLPAATAERGCTSSSSGWSGRVCGGHPTSLDTARRYSFQVVSRESALHVTRFDETLSASLWLRRQPLAWALE